jgi:predicted dehydrogenase
MHHERFEVLRKRLPDLGLVPTFMDSAFTFRADPSFFESNIRASAETEPLGALGDLGWYCIRMALVVMDAMPTAVRARHHELHEGVPIHTTAELEFAGPEGPRIARFQCSFRHPLRQWVEIVGEHGAMWMHDFVIGSPTEAVIDLETESSLTEGDAAHRRHHERITVNDCVQQTAMVERFSRIAAGLDPIDPQWPRWALDTQRVMDAVMSAAAESMDVHLPDFD